MSGLMISPAAPGPVSDASPARHERHDDRFAEVLNATVDAQPDRKRPADREPPVGGRDLTSQPPQDAVREAHPGHETQTRVDEPAGDEPAGDETTGEESAGTAPTDPDAATIVVNPSVDGGAFRLRLTRVPGEGDDGGVTVHVAAAATSETVASADGVSIDDALSAASTTAADGGLDALVDALVDATDATDATDAKMSGSVASVAGDTTVTATPASGTGQGVDHAGPGARAGQAPIGQADPAGGPVATSVVAPETVSDTELTSVTGVQAAAVGQADDGTAVASTEQVAATGTPADAAAAPTDAADGPTRTAGSMAQATPAVADAPVAAPAGDVRPGRPAVPTPPAAQLASAVAALRRRGDGEYNATIDLHPSELGRVQVQVEIRAGVVNLSVLAEQTGTRTLLAQQMDDLRSSLQQSGLDAGDLDVSSQAWAGGQGDQHDGEAADGPRDGKSRSAPGQDSNIRQARSPNPTPSVTAASGLDLRL